MTQHSLLTVSKLTSTLTLVVRFITATPGTPSAWSQTPPTTTRFSPITWAEWEYLRFTNDHVNLHQTDHSIKSCTIKSNKIWTWRDSDTLVPRLDWHATSPSRSPWTWGSAGRHLLKEHLLGPGLQRSPVPVYRHKWSGSDVVQGRTLQVGPLYTQIIKDKIHHI